MAGALPFDLIRKDQLVRKDGTLDIDALVRILNANQVALQAALRNGLTFSANMRCERIDYTLTTAAVLADSFPFNILPKRVKAPDYVWLARCREDVASPATLTSQPFADWELLAGDKVQVKSIAALSAAKTYSLTFLLISE